MNIYELIKRGFGWGPKEPAARRPVPSAPVPSALPSPSASPVAPETAREPPAESPKPEPIRTPEPFAPATNPNERRRKRRVNAPEGTRVLIVDDSATIVALLRRMMLQNKYVVLEAGDAEHGLELAKSEKPQLIFLDIVLPGMNGFTALRMLRRDPETKAVPIIMISGNEQATEEFYVQRIGADDFMKKPFSRAEVFARLEKLIEAERLPRRPDPVAAAEAAAPSGPASDTQ